MLEMAEEEDDMVTVVGDAVEQFEIGFTFTSQVGERR